MASYGRQVRLWLWIATSAFLIIFFLDCLWSTSVDLADHITYVGRILDTWSLSAARSFGYPLPLYGHVIAAVLAAPLSSPVAGVQLATLLSLVGLWSGFALVFQSLQRRMLVHVGLALLVLLALNRFFFRLELHGNEIIVNFFFSHLVAQAAAIVAVALALLTERQSTQPELKYFVLAVSIPLVESLHLMPTLQLFGVLVLLVATDFLVQPKNSRLKTLGIGAMLIVVSAAGIVLNPTFAPSVRVSSHFAGLPLLRTPYIKTLAILCVVVGMLSVLLLYKWLYSTPDGEARCNGAAVKYIALYGLSNSGLCLSQIFMRQLGYGSEYVCKKYAFALNTTLLFELALLISLLINPRWFKSNPENPKLTARLFDVAFVSLFLLAAFFTVLPKEKVIDASKLATIERFARTYTHTAFNNSPGTFNYAVGLDLPAAANMNYFITTDALNAPPAWAHANTQDVYADRPFSQPSQVAHILTSLNAEPWDIPRCRTQFSSASLVVLDGQCVISALRDNSKCFGRVDFSVSGHVALFSTEGFDDPEETGRWTIGPQASFVCQFPAGVKKEHRTAEITASGFSASDKVQRVLLSVNDEPPKQYEFKNERTITIELPSDTDQLKLDFGLPDAVSPRDLGLSDDPRKLGIYVRAIRFGLS